MTHPPRKNLVTFAVGDRVRQRDWLLQPRGYRDGTVNGLEECATGTPHRWLTVRFPGHLTGEPFFVRVSSSQLEPTP